MSYIGNEPVIGHFPVDEFTSNGSSQTYTLSKIPPTVNSIEVSVGGLLQPPSVYSISGTTLTLPTSGANVPNGIKVVVRHLGEKLQVATVDSISGYNLTGIVVAKGDGASTPGKVKINCEMNSHGVTIQSPAHSSSANYTLTLPTTDGNASEFLQTDGSGALSWGAAGGGGATTLIARNTFSANSVSITGFDSSKYDSYLLLIRWTYTSGGDMFWLRTSTDGGSSYNSGGSDYQYAGQKCTSDGSNNNEYYSNGAHHIGLGIQNNDFDSGASTVAEIRLTQNHLASTRPWLFTRTAHYKDNAGSGVSEVQWTTVAGCRTAVETVNGLQIGTWGSGTLSDAYQFIGYNKA